MALNKLKYNSLNLTPAANKAIGFDSDADEILLTKNIYLCLEIFIHLEMVLIFLLTLA